MAKGGRIDYTVGFNVDNTGLQSIKTQLQELSRIKPIDFLNANPELGGLEKAKTELKDIQDVVKQVHVNYEEAFDSTTGVLNINKLSSSLKNIGMDKIYASFQKLGPVGVKAFYDINNQLTKVNLKFKETNNLLEKMGQTLVNTIKWNISSSAINKFTGSIQQAYGYVQHLDTSLNNIRMVTGKSADEMDRFSESANKAAKSLGASTTDYTEAALIYYQQGLSDDEAAARTETTVKAANVTGQTGKQVSEELTAVWNGYKVTAEETELYVDKLAAVAATSASNLEELSIGMSKVASAANAMGVDIDQLNAQLSTIISVTRQAPETAGTALKTIYARMEDLKIDGETEDGVKLGEVSSTLDEVGVHIMDVNGDIRDLGEVIEEVGNKWYTWTEAQQLAIAQAIAGKRQYNNLLALFNNWDQYNKELEVSRNAIGTLQNQQDAHMESTVAHLQELKTAQEGLYDSLLKPQDINSVVDGLTKTVELSESFIDSIGGGKVALVGIIGLLGQIPGISGAISSTIGDMVLKTMNASENTRNWNTWMEDLEGKLVEGTSAYEKQKALLESIKATTHSLTDEEKQRVAQQIRLLAEKGKEKDILESEQGFAAQVVRGVAENTEDYDYSDKSFNEMLGSDDLDAIKEMFIGQNVEVEKAKQKLEEYKQKLQEIAELKDQYGTNAKYDKELQELQNIRNDLQESLKIVSPSAEGTVKYLNNLLDETEDIVKDINKGSEDLNEQVTKIGVTETAAYKTIEETQETVLETIQNGNKELDETQGEFNDAADAAEDKIEKMNTDQIGQGVSQLVSGFSSLVFSMQAIKNLGSIWNNDDLSVGEKVLQTVTNLTTALPMLIAGFSSVRQGWADLSGQFGFINQKIAESTAYIQGHTVATQAMNTANEETAASSATVVAAQEAETIASTENATATTAETVASEADAVAKGEEAGATVTEAGAEEVDTAAKTGNTVTTGALIKTIGSHIAARLTETVTILGVTAALAAYVAVAAVAIVTIAAIVYAVNKHEKAMRDANDAIIEQSNKTQEQVNTNNELADSYLELYKTYKETGEVSDELKESAEKCTETLDLQRGSVQLLAEDYDGLAESIKKAKAEETKKGLDSAKKERDAAEGNLLDSATDGILNNGVGNQTSIVIGYGANGWEEKQAIQTLRANLADTSADYYDQFLSGTIVTDYDAESILEVYDALVKTRDELAASGQQSTDVYKNISAWINKTTEDVEAYRAAVQDIETYATQLAGINIDENQIVDIESYSKIRDDTIKKIKEETGIEDDDRAATLADTWLSQNLSEESQEYMNQFNAASKLFSQYKDQIDGLTQEKVQEFVSKMVQNDTFKYQAYMTDEDWKNILGANSVEDAEIYIQDVINRHQEDIKKSVQEQASIFSDNMQEIIDNVNSGDLTFANIGLDETFITMKDNIDNLLVAFPELTEEANIFLTEGMVGSEEWAEAAYQIKDAYDQLEFQQLNDNLDTALEELNKLAGEDQYDENGFKINVDADTSDFQDAVEKVLNARYSIDIKLYADGIKEFEDLEESMDDIDTMASKIGDEFIVAADDIRELNNTFPGILEGMEYLADGTVQLNDEVVQSAMSAATAEETASVDTTATKLENTAKELRAKADMYDDMADLAEDAANGEADLEEQKQNIINKLNQVETENNKKVANSEIDNSHAVVDDSAENAPLLAENWNKAYQEAAQAANDWATLATEANKAVANGEDWNAEEHKGDFAVNFTGSKSKSTTSTTVANIEDADRSTMGEIANTFRNTATAYRKNANDLEGAAAEIRAKALSSATTNADVADGVTADDSSDSSSSEQEAETEEYLEREEDLYRAINEELDDIESTLGRIEKTQDHSWGLSYKNTLEDQNELLKDQLELLEKKKDTYEDDLSTRRKQLEDQGVTFSEDGSVMTNAETRLNELYDEYNSMVDTYNSMTASQQEAYSSTLEAQKDTIDNIEDAMDDYESAYSDYNSVLDELLDTHYELIENEVNQFNADVEIHLELAEAEDTWNDFWYDVVQDVDDTDFGGKIAKSFSKLSTLTGENGTINELTHHLNDVVAEVDKQIAGADIGGGDSIFGDDTELSKETLIDYRDKLIDAVTAAKENIDDMVDTYLDALDDAKDKIDEQIEGWETVGDHIEHNIELIKLVSGDKAYDAIGKQYEQMYENNLSLVRDAKSGMDFWQERMNYYQQQMTSAQTEAERENFEQFYKKAKENYTDAVKTLDSSLTNAIEKRKDAFLNVASKIADKMDKAFSKGMGISGVKNEWDLALEKQEHYLDNVERSLAMEELDGIFKDILDDMDARSDKQQEFLKFQDEEIAKLNEREKLTQYDIDELKARLEIKKQELALEEAQQNKSNLRLRRDSQGNYSYQYTADEDAIDDAQDGLLNARQEWYELVKKRNQETAEAVIEIRTRALEVMEERSQALADKDLARAEELTMTLKALQDEEKYYMQDAEKAKRDFFWGTAEFFEDVEQNTILPMWNTTIEQMIDEFVENGEDSFVGAVKTGISEVDREQEKFVEDTDKLLSTAGVNYKELVSTGIDPTTESLKSLNQTEEEFNDTLDETIDLFDDLESNISEATAAYNELKDAAVGAIEEANRALNTLAATAVSAISQINSAISSAESATSLAASKAGNINSGSNSNNGDSSGGSSTATVSYSLVGDPNGVSGTYGVRNDSTGTYVAIYNNKADAEAKLAELQAEEYKKIVGVGSGTHQVNTGRSTKTKVQNYARKNGITIKSYDTGGYTGDWGTTDGRLALLHQKELVLNEADTTNILTAVQSVRDLVKGNTVGNFSGIAESIASMAQAQVQTLAQVGSGMLQAIASMVNNSNSEVQNYRNMTVNADFSGVRSADAIYQALMELDNYGVQQAYSNAPSANKSY